MKPDLRVRNYDYAVEQAIVDLGLVLAGADPRRPSDQGDTNSPWTLPIVGGLFAGIGGLIFW